MIIAAFGLLLFFGLGAPVALCLPDNLRDRWSAAPVFGLAISGVVLTLAYFNGVLNEATITLTAIAAISLISCSIMVRDRVWLLSLAGYGLLVCVACLAPMWVGAWKFAIFQSNPFDQFNYISAASAYSFHSYQSLAATGAESEYTYVRMSASFLSRRPTVAVVLAAIRPWFYVTTAEAAFPFQALLQALSAFGALFALRNIFGFAKPVGLVAATAFAIGFFPQYVSDINAWSSLSSLSFAPVAVALIYLMAVNGCGVACAGPLAVVLAGILYFYPESFVTSALACGVVGLGGMALSQNRVRTAGYLALAAGATLMACLPAWHSNIGYMFSQVRASHSAPWEWFTAYDSFYFADLGPPHHDWTAYRIFSTPIDGAAGLLGVYFLSPTPWMPTSVKIAWKLVELSFFIALVVTVLRSIKTRHDALFVVGCAATLVLPLALLVRGDHWSAGKAVTMIAPLLFLVLAFPLSQGHRRLAIPVTVLMALQFGFGFQRIIGAGNETGARAVGNGYPEYPSYLKAQFDWAVPRWRAEMVGCGHVAVDVEDGYVERLVETVLNDLKISADFRTDRYAKYDGGSIMPATASPRVADCTVSDRWVAAGTSKLIYLSTIDHHDLLQLPGATGLHGLEKWHGELLRWTDGNAQWTIRSEARISAIDISFWPDVMPSDRVVKILLNGREIAKETVWRDVRRFPIDQDGPLTISIRSEATSSPADPRKLGLALKSIRFED